MTKSAQYTEEILKLFDEPKYCGSLSDDCVLKSKVEGIDFNEFINVFVKLDDCSNIIDVKYQVLGCPYLIACCEVAAEWLLGKEKKDLIMFDYNYLVEYLKLPNLKIYCAILVSEAIHKL